MVSHNQSFQDSTALLLGGLDQQIHFWVDRLQLLQAIQDQTPSFEHSALDNNAPAFDNNFFIPQAFLHLPVDTANVNLSGDYTLRFSLTSNLDSLYSSNSDFVEYTLKANSDPTQFVTTSVSITSPPLNEVIDTLQLQYLPFLESDSSFRFILSFTNETSPNDTVVVTPNQQKSLVYAKTNSNNFLIQLEFFISSISDSITVSFFNSITNQFERIDTINDFSTSTQDTLSITATQGIQTLFNRNTNSIQRNEFVLRPVFNSAFELDSNLTTTEALLSEVPLQLDANGKLKFDLTIYYFRQTF